MHSGLITGRLFYDANANFDSCGLFSNSLSMSSVLIVG